MFLSHALAIFFGLCLVPAAMLTDNHNVLDKVVGTVGFVVLAVATYRLSRIRWIWIGPTGEQITRSIEDLSAQIAQYDKVLFDPSATPETLPQGARAEIIKARKRLFERRRKREELLSRYTVTSPRR